MATANAAKEPSMEEILASIRQIIADEDAPVAEPAQEEKNDQAAIDDAFDNADDVEMSTDDVDALFDAPGDPGEEIDQSAIDAAFDTPADDVEMSTDDVDALFDAPEPEPAPEEDDDDVLALSADQAVDADDDDISFDAVDEAPVAAVAAPEPAPVVAAPAVTPAAAPIPDLSAAPDPALLLSNDAASAVQASFGALNSAMSVSAGYSLEDLVRGMLHPMLKEWLNENLPGIVDQKVQAEIERMTRK